MSKEWVKNLNAFLNISDKHLNKKRFSSHISDVSQTFLLFEKSDKLSNDPKRSRYIFA